MNINNSTITFEENSSGAGGVIYANGSTMNVNESTITFEGNTATNGGGAILNFNPLIFYLQTANDKIIFSDNSPDVTDHKTNGITNRGSITIEGVSGSSFELGKNVFFSSNASAVLILKGGVELILNGGFINFSPDYTTTGLPALVIAVNKFDTEILDDEGTHEERGGSGGILSIKDGGALEGYLNLSFSFSGTALESLGALNVGETLEYKYIYSESDTPVGSFTPIFFNDGSESTVVSVSGIEDKLFELDFPETTSRGGDTTEDTNYGVLHMKIKNEESSNAEDYEQYNPDPNMMPQVESVIANIQSSDNIIADRLSSDVDDSSFDDSSLEPTSELLIAAAGKNALSYGLAKDRSTREEYLSRIWLQLLGSFGIQKLEENSKTSSFGFVIGSDYRIKKNIKIGIAQSFSSSNSKSNLRSITNTNYNFSIYGDYNLGNLYTSATATYGMVRSDDNKLFGKWDVIYLTPRVGYRFHIRNSSNLKMNIAPEIALRYFRVYQHKQSSERNSISAVTRDIFAIAPALRFTALFREKFELSAKLGFGYDIANGGDDSYRVTMDDGQSYQISDKSDKSARLATELGLTLGYRVANSLRFSIGYNGKYARDITNNSISLESSFKF
jgi:predicted outer membrane repeat protein